MPNVRRRAPRESEEPPAPSSNLPLRWVVILAVAALIGIGTGYLASPLAGIATGIAFATFLHKAVD
jgi:hypothetical protein